MIFFLTMSLFKVLSLALFVAMTCISSIHSSFWILHRDSSVSSVYSLDDACNHEWQYLNFNLNDNINRIHFQKLHDVICSDEMHAIFSYDQVSTQNILVLYKRFFSESDLENDFQTHVKDVLDLIAKMSSMNEAIESVVETFVVNNLDESYIHFETFSSLLSSYLFVIFTDSFCKLCHK